MTMTIEADAGVVLGWRRGRPFVSRLAVYRELDADASLDIDVETADMESAVSSTRANLARMETRQSTPTAAPLDRPADPVRDTAGAIVASLAAFEHCDPKAITRNLVRSTVFQPLRVHSAAQGDNLTSNRRILRWLADVPDGQTRTRYRLLLDRAATLMGLLEANGAD